MKGLIRDTGFGKNIKHLLTAHKKCFENFSNVILCLWNWQRYREHVWYPKHTFKMRRKCSGDSQTSFIKFHVSFFWRSLISSHPIPEFQKKDVWFFMNMVWMSLEHFLLIRTIYMFLEESCSNWKMCKNFFTLMCSHSLCLQNKIKFVSLFNS